MSDENVIKEIFPGERYISFWHSDESEPFMKIFANKIFIYVDIGVVEVYSDDYEEPIVVVHEWDFWT